MLHLEGRGSTKLLGQPQLSLDTPHGRDSSTKKDVIGHVGVKSVHLTKEGRWLLHHIHLADSKSATDECLRVRALLAFGG